MKHIGTLLKIIRNFLLVFVAVDLFEFTQFYLVMLTSPRLGKIGTMYLVQSLVTHLPFYLIDLGLIVFFFKSTSSGKKIRAQVALTLLVVSSAVFNYGIYALTGQAPVILGPVLKIARDSREGVPPPAPVDAEMKIRKVVPVELDPTNPKDSFVFRFQLSLRKEPICPRDESKSVHNSDYPVSLCFDPPMVVENTNLKPKDCASENWVVSNCTRWGLALQEINLFNGYEARLPKFSGGKLTAEYFLDGNGNARKGKLFYDGHSLAPFDNLVGAVIVPISELEVTSGTWVRFHLEHGVNFKCPPPGDPLYEKHGGLPTGVCFSPRFAKIELNYATPEGCTEEHLFRTQCMPNGKINWDNLEIIKLEKILIPDWYKKDAAYSVEIRFSGTGLAYAMKLLRDGQVVAEAGESRN